MPSRGSAITSVPAESAAPTPRLAPTATLYLNGNLLYFSPHVRKILSTPPSFSACASSSVLRRTRCSPAFFHHSTFSFVFSVAPSISARSFSRHSFGVPSGAGISSCGSAPSVGSILPLDSVTSGAGANSTMSPAGPTCRVEIGFPCCRSSSVLIAASIPASPSSTAARALPTNRSAVTCSSLTPIVPPSLTRVPCIFILPAAPWRSSACICSPSGVSDTSSRLICAFSPSCSERILLTPSNGTVTDSIAPDCSSVGFFVST